MLFRADGFGMYGLLFAAWLSGLRRRGSPFDVHSKSKFHGSGLRASDLQQGLQVLAWVWDYILFLQRCLGASRTTCCRFRWRRQSCEVLKHSTALLAFLCLGLRACVGRWKVCPKGPSTRNLNPWNLGTRFS